MRFRGRVLASLLLFMASFSAYGATRTWFGGNGYWNTPMNWIGGMVPGPMDDAVINGGVVTLNMNAQIQSLTVTGMGSIESMGPYELQVTGDVSLTGTGSFSSGANKITLLLKAGMGNAALTCTLPGGLGGDLRIETTGTTVALGSDVAVGGKLELANGTLDVTPANYNLYLAGNLIVNTGAGFIPNQGKVTFTGVGSTVSFNPPPPHFWDLAVVSGCTTTMMTPVDIASNCTLDGVLESNGFNLMIGGNLSGTGFLTAGSAEIITVNGDFMVSGFTEANSVVVLTGSTPSSLQGLPFFGLRIDKSLAGAAVTSVGPLTVHYYLDMIQGTWNAGSYQHTIGGDWVSNSIGFEFLADTSTIRLTNSAPVIHTKGLGESFYDLTLNAGGSLSSELQVDRDLTIATGAAGTLNLNGYPLTVGRHFMGVNMASLSAGGGQNVIVGGDWGVESFAADMSQLVFNNAAQISNIFGNNSFYDFSCTTPGKELRFEAGATQTINGSFVITGASANHVRLLSQLSGSQWTIDNAGNSESVSFASVQDSLVLGNDITVTDGTDLGNNKITGSPRWIFPDTTPPTVISTQPINGATDVVVSTSVQVVFSESMTSSTINTSTFRLEEGGIPVTGSVAYDDPSRTAVFTPGAALAYGTIYTVIITTGVHDAAGNPLSAAYSWSFTTAPAPDVTPPTVISTIPAAAATDVAVGTTVQAIFSEAMTASTINASTFLLDASGVPVSGSVVYDDPSRTAVFTPDMVLAYGTTYTAKITNGARDAAGNALSPDYSWSFTTAPDTTPPTVTSTIPADAATDVAVSTTVQAVFSEPMLDSTINTSTFRLEDGGTPVSGSVSYNGSTRTAVFTPGAALANGTTYTATITTGAQDAAGNPLSAEYSWSFTTTSAADTTPPTVTSTLPVNGASDVSVGTTVEAMFSESMLTSTINGSTFLLEDAGVPVTGSVSYNGSPPTAVFSPDSALAYDTTFTATVTTGARDTAGNPLSAEYSWSFTTAPAPDLTPPTVTSTLPVNGASDVAVGTTVQAVFSESMTSSTINNSTFRLEEGGVPVSGSVSYNDSTHRAVFTPGTNLSNGTIYIAILSTGVQDEAGNPLSGDYSWSFTTTSAPDTTPPAVTSTQPVDGAIDVAVGTPVEAMFSESMNLSTINGSTFRLEVGGAPVSGSVSYSGSPPTAVFRPDSPLAYDTAYTAILTTGLQDATGNPLSAQFSWSFTTEAPRPTLLVSAGANSPGSSTVTADAARVPMLLLSFAASVEDVQLDSLTINGSGTGDERRDVKTVRLYLDTDANGQLDAGESELGSASFSKDDGAVTFGGLGVTIPNGSSVNLLVTYDFDVVTLTGNAAPTRWVRPAKPGPGLPVAAMALVALASGLMFLLRLHGKRPRRPLAAVRALVAAGLVTAALFASSCLLKPLKDSTYAAVLANSANVRAQGVSSGSPAAVTGTFPVAGAWKSVDTIDGGL